MCSPVLLTKRRANTRFAPKDVGNILILTQSRFDKSQEKRMRGKGAGEEFGVELGGDEKWVVFPFYDFNERVVGRGSGGY